MRLQNVVLGCLAGGLLLAAALALFKRTSANFALSPSDPKFSGEWIVHSRQEDVVVLQSTYKDGKKEGIERSWYVVPRVPRILQTIQHFSNDLLDGLCERHDRIPNSKPLLSGIFSHGKPWQGTFLVNARNEIVESPFIPFDMPDVVWFAARYEGGAEVERGYVGPKGFVSSHDVMMDGMKARPGRP